MAGVVGAASAGREVDALSWKVPNINERAFPNVRPFLAVDARPVMAIANRVSPTVTSDWELCGQAAGAGVVSLCFFPGGEGLVYVPPLAGERTPYRLGAEGVVSVLRKLQERVDDGYDLVTWGGLRHGLRAMSGESRGAAELARPLARRHIDLAFQMLCERGFSVDFWRVWQAMCRTLAGEGLPVVEARACLPPVDVGEADRLPQELVLAVQRAQVGSFEVACVYAEAVQDRRLCWQTQRSQLGRWTLGLHPHGELWRGLYAEEAVLLPQPDTSWMAKPVKREDVYGWTRDTPLTVAAGLP